MKFCYHCMHQIRNNRHKFCPRCGKEIKVHAVPARFLPPGTILQGRFVLGYPIGSGGFGNTYIGWNASLSRKVAIKEFFPSQYIGRGVDGVTVTVSDRTMENRFQKGLRAFLDEARKIAALHDVPGVIAVSSFFREHGTGYIVMEYLEGDDVRHLLQKSGGRMDYAQSRYIILSVLYTLREIHKRGILHRDIAPDNVFVTSDGVVKLIDFGAARQAFVSVERDADIVLKRGYSPIEQYSQDAQQGAYTDLYAVAAMLYRILTGQRPMPADERLNQDLLVPPSRLGVVIPARAEQGMMECLNIRPEYRMKNAGELMRALDGSHFVPRQEPEMSLPTQEERPDSHILPIVLIGAVTLCVIMVSALCVYLIWRPEKNPEKKIEETADREDLPEEKEEFFYWESLPDFKAKYRNIKGLDFPVYSWENGEDEEPVLSGTRKLFASDYVVKDYYTFSNTQEDNVTASAVGDVIEQTIPAGEKVDTSQADVQPFLHVLGEKTVYDNQIGYDVVEALREFGDDVEIKVMEGDLSQPLLYLDVFDESGGEIKYFKKSDKILVELHLKGK